MSIVLKSIDFEWPNGHVVFKNLSLSLESQQKYGLIGPNGTGKSTLARLIQGVLLPHAGMVQIKERVSYFAQFENPPHETLGEYLSELWYNVTPSDMNVVESLQAGLNFEASCLTLSGGEWTKARLLKQLSSGADFIILDEPTNNLDREAKASVLEFVQRTSRGVLVISHDRELLEWVSVILELSNQGLSSYGGNWSQYESERDLERSRLLENLEHAESEQYKARQERIKKLASQTKRMKQAERSAPNLGLPKILIGARKRNAQKTLGKLEVATEYEVSEKVNAARAAFTNLKTDPVIYADFPETAISAGKLVFEARALNFQYEGSSCPLWKDDLTFSAKGAAKVSIVGGNGSGKTTLLNLITGFKPPRGTMSGYLKLADVQFALIDQQTKILDPDKTVFENAYMTSQKSIIEIRNLLAQFLFPGKKADQVVSTLSGGECIRAALAKILISDPAPQFLILDEPTNSLDLMNLKFLENALSRFQGAMLVVSHDITFLQNIGVTEEIRLSS